VTRCSFTGLTGVLSGSGSILEQEDSAIATQKVLNNSGKQRDIDIILKR
jgi:hypothetical protein